MRHPVLIVMFLIGAGCRSATTPTQPTQESERPGPEWFRDVTSELGIEYRLTVGPTGDYFMPQVMGSGVAIFDANNDDRPDILVLANAGPQEIRRELASFVSDRAIVPVVIRAHFGLGSVTTIDEIRFDWPDGSSEVFSGGTVDRAITLNRGTGQKVER